MAIENYLKELVSRKKELQKGLELSGLPIPENATFSELVPLANTVIKNQFIGNPFLMKIPDDNITYGDEDDSFYLKIRLGSHNWEERKELWLMAKDDDMKLSLYYNYDSMDNNSILGVINFEVYGNEDNPLLASSRFTIKSLDGGLTYLLDTEGGATTITWSETEDNDGLYTGIIEIPNGAQWRPSKNFKGFYSNLLF